MIRRVPFWVGFAMLAGCGLLEIQQDPGPRETPIVLKRDDSAAIIALKQSLGVWNGNVMDWVTYAVDSQVIHLVIQNPKGFDVRIPEIGLKKTARVFVYCGRDSAFNVSGLDALPSLIEFGSGGSNGVKLNMWPRGFFCAKSLRKITIDGVMQYVPDSLAMIDSLRVVDMWGGELNSVPKVFLRMPKLDTVLLAQNRICNPSDSEKLWLDAHAPGWKWQNCP